MVHRAAERAFQQFVGLGTGQVADRVAPQQALLPQLGAFTGPGGDEHARLPVPDHVVQQRDGRVIEQMRVVDDDRERCGLGEQVLDGAAQWVPGAHVRGQHRGHRPERDR